MSNSDQEWLENRDRELPVLLVGPLAESLKNLCSRAERRERLIREQQLDVWRKVS
jgi:hypothetical protein